jgi:hypothetical protein
MMMQMVGAFAEFERAILRERTKAGLDAARKQGRIGGRRPKLRPNQQAPKLPLMPQDFSMCIRRQCRGFWLKRVLGLYQSDGLMHLCDVPAMGRRQPNQRAEILRMVNSGKTSAAEAARLFWVASFKRGAADFTGSR